MLLVPNYTVRSHSQSAQVEFIDENGGGPMVQLVQTVYGMPQLAINKLRTPKLFGLQRS